jgi:rhodanese-related sulfurtransferase
MAINKSIRKYTMFGFNTPEVPQISADEVKKSIDEKSDVVLLDVRTTGEFEKGSIAQSINLPVDEIDKKIETVVSDKSKTIYVFCLSGSRSVYAVDTMIKKGYTHVFSITQGMLRWRGSGYPVSTS